MLVLGWLRSPPAQKTKTGLRTGTKQLSTVAHQTLTECDIEKKYDTLFHCGTRSFFYVKYCKTCTARLF